MRRIGLIIAAILAAAPAAWAECEAPQRPAQPADETREAAERLPLPTAEAREAAEAAVR